jgi:hypothetical protein
MAEDPLFTVVALIHLISLALWGGVVATEAVIEILPFRRPELHGPTIRLHYWIDLLVELPLVLAVAATGGILVTLAPDITGLHLVKVAFASGAIAVNLFCIAVVLVRAHRLDRGTSPDTLWAASRTVLACFVAGLACAAVAATLGFRFALERLA